MKDVMEFDGGYKAVIAYDPEIEMFRGEFAELNGGADFYAADLEGLRREGVESLRIFLEECERHGVSPRKERKERKEHKERKGNFALRLDPETCRQASIAAAARGVSLNSFICDAVQQAVAAS